ncbi:hypothetical protein [Krasilnikovia sp. M28-CT-15]|uniref:hypothetical protein n=1 Tax=Krasilnikovia sp. M28-CT-15 TaxID=3373540 RepID=UPI003875AFD2
MNDKPQPVPATTDIPTTGPRIISRAVMDDHAAAGRVVPLSPADRHRIYVHYDNAWWIADPHGYLEITSPQQTTKLDRWHQRVARGALWD